MIKNYFITIAFLLVSIFVFGQNKQPLHKVNELKSSSVSADSAKQMKVVKVSGEKQTRNAYSVETINNVTIEKNKLDEPIIVSFPITANKSTDLNKEVNILKSKEVRELYAQEAKVIVKNENYYQTKINQLESNISDIEIGVISESVNPSKLEAYKLELDLWKAELVLYKINK